MYSFLRVLAVLFMSLASVCHADDCKPVADALKNLSSSPVHITWSVKTLDANGECKSITVGLSRRNVGERSTPSPDWFPAENLDSCRYAGLEKLKAQAVQHYYTITQDPVRKISEFWLAVDTGEMVKRSETSQENESKWEYDYTPEKVFSLF
jgi:hypothetical protein